MFAKMIHNKLLCKLVNKQSAETIRKWLTIVLSIGIYDAAFQFPENYEGHVVPMLIVPWSEHFVSL